MTVSRATHTVPLLASDASHHHVQPERPPQPPDTHPRRHAATPSAVTALLTIATLLWCATPSAAQRVVAVADIHGNADGFTRILQAAELLDGDGHWAGGDATFVQTGDFTDRGDAVRAVMDLLMRLEGEATEAGGRVVVLLGNHEVMNMMRDVRDVTPAIYATFADDRSEARREQAYVEYRAWAEAVDVPAAGEDSWRTIHPPGYFAYREALAPDGHYGRWLREKPIVAQIDGSIFLHGGIHPAVAPPGLDAKNAQAREELAAFDRDRARLIEAGALLPFSELEDMITVVRALRGADPAGRNDAGCRAGDPTGRDVLVVDRRRERAALVSRLRPVAVGGW